MITKTKYKSKNKLKNTNTFRKFLSFLISAVLILSAFIPVVLSPAVSSAASKQISFDSTTYEDYLASTSSVNRYFFDLTSQGTVTVKFETFVTTKTPSWRMRLLDSSDSIVYADKNFGSGEADPNSPSRVEYSDKVRLPAGRYYIDISVPEGYAVISNTYKISLSFSAENGKGYAVKPNSTINTASALTLNSSVISNISYNKDVNYFKVSLPYHGSLNISFSAANTISAENTADKGNWVVLLYDENEKQMMMSRVGAEGEVKDNIRTNKLSKLRLPPGEYYIKVVPVSETVYSTADYTIRADYTPERSAKFEREFNGTADTSNNLLVNAPVTGNMNSVEDRDFYKFTAGVNKDMRIDFTSPAGINQNMWTIYIQDGKGGITTYYAGQNGTVSDGLRTFSSAALDLNPGIYYIVVYPYSLDAPVIYSNTDYTLTVHSDSAPVPVIPDDDNIGHFTEIPASAYNVNRDMENYIKNANDKNIFEFGINHSGSVSLDFQCLQSVTKQSWIVNIFDKNDRQFYSGKFGDTGIASSAAGLKTVSSDKIRIPAGSYYVQVLPINSYDYSVSTYRLRINYAPESKDALLSDIDLYESELNDTPLTANTLSLSSPLTANLSDYNDIDYFKFTLTKHGKVNILFVTPKSVNHNNWTAAILTDLTDLTGDSDNLPVFTADFGADGDSGDIYSGFDYKTESSNGIRLPPGTYYIKVSAPNVISYSNADYIIKADFTDEIPGGGVLYETEFNNTPETSDVLPINTDMTGNVFNTSDSDFYKINIDKSKEIQIKFSTSPKVNAGLWALKLYDSAFREFKSYKIGGEGGVISLDGFKYFKTEKMHLLTGIYYVSVTPYSQNETSSQLTEEYTLKVIDDVGQKIDTYVYPADRPSDWAEYEVGLAYGYDLIPAEYMKNFTSPIKREEFCALIIKFLEVYENKPIADILAGAKRAVNSNAFTDTNNINILSANALGIVNGKGGGIFDPYGNITREEAAAMLMRLGKIMSISVNIESLEFKDASKFRDWSSEAIAYVSGCVDKRSNRVMNGYADGSFHSFDSYSREQAFMTIFRLYSIKTGV